MVSSTNAAYNLTVNNSASGSYALKVMTIAAAIFFPLVLALPGLVVPRVPRPREGSTGRRSERGTGAGRGHNAVGTVSPEQGDDLRGVRP